MEDHGKVEVAESEGENDHEDMVAQDWQQSCFCGFMGQNITRNCLILLSI